MGTDLGLLACHIIMSIKCFGIGPSLSVLKAHCFLEHSAGFKFGPFMGYECWDLVLHCLFSL